MRPLTMTLLCMTTVALGLVGISLAEGKGNIDILRSAPAELVPIYEYHKNSGDSKLLEQAVLQADMKVRDAIRQLFEKSGKLKSVMAQTKDVIRWCEWPADLSYRKRLIFRLDDGRYDKKVRINYRHFKAAKGADVYVMQNSFWNRKGRGRVCPGIYTVVITGGKATMSPLPSTVSGLLGLSMPPSFLGYVDGGKSLPELVILHGPIGSGSFHIYSLYSYDTESGRWTNRSILESSGPNEFSYDEKSNALLYQTTVGGQGHKLIRVTRTYVICGRSSPLRLQLSAIPGVTCTTDKAPVSITFVNTGDKTITIRHDFTEQRRYLPLTLYIELRRKDGTLVSRPPKEGLLPHNDKPVYVTLKANKPYSFIMDVAKLREGLEDGEYTLSVQYSSETDTRGFMGLVRSNVMGIRIGTEAPIPSKNGGDE